MKEICWNKSKDLRPEFRKIELRLASRIDFDTGHITEISYDNKSDAWQIVQGFYDAITMIHYSNEYVQYNNILNMIKPIISEITTLKIIRPYIDDKYRILVNDVWKVKSLVLTEEGYSGYLIYDNSNRK